MIYLLSGILVAKKGNFVVVDNGGVGYKVFVPARLMGLLPSSGEPTTLFTYFNVREDAQELYGFLEETDLVFFEQLMTVNGVGPKSALAIMALSPADTLASAIVEGRVDVFQRAAGVGKKTAERVVLELKGKVASIGSGEAVLKTESDMDMEEALHGLGYSHLEAKRAIQHIPHDVQGFENRLKAALKIIKT